MLLNLAFRITTATVVTLGLVAALSALTTLLYAWRIRLEDEEEGVITQYVYRTPFGDLIYEDRPLSEQVLANCHLVFVCAQTREEEPS